MFLPGRQQQHGIGVVGTSNSERILMVAPVIHRKWAREFLARADRASSRDRKLGLLRLAVDNTVRAINLEASATPTSPGTETDEQRHLQNSGREPDDA
jgi:hypothetical protein